MVDRGRRMFRETEEYRQLFGVIDSSIGRKGREGYFSANPVLARQAMFSLWEWWGENCDHYIEEMVRQRRQLAEESKPSKSSRP